MATRNALWLGGPVLGEEAVGAVLLALGIGAVHTTAGTVGVATAGQLALRDNGLARVWRFKV